jgi:adenylate cyclase
VMAFWGAPHPDALHALHACEAALANRSRLAELNARWEKEGRPRLDARAALHTGEVIVGNIGSPERLDYTVIGDSVNLASRLEGLNKRYGTSLMISETTYALVKGKAVAVNVYELLGKRTSVPAADALSAARHTEGFAYYVSRRFTEAAAIFRSLSERSEEDLAARVLLARCEAFVVSPPGPDWDGADRVTTK